MLRQNDRIGIGLFYRIPEIPPKLVVGLSGMPKIGRHVQAPSIHIKGGRHPFFRDLHNIFIQLRRFLVIQLGEGAVPPPAVVIAVIRPCFVVIKFKKRVKRAVLRDVGSRFIAALALIDPFPVQPFIK